MSKGSKRERECCDLFKRAGMAVYRPATVRYGENDMFGLFDLLAVSPVHDDVYAVQVKSNRASGIRDWRRHTGLFRALGWRTFYAVPVDREGWRLIECTDGGKETRVDERDMNVNMGNAVADYLSGEA